MIRLSVAVMHAPWEAQRRAWVTDIARACPPTQVERFDIVGDAQRQGCWPTARRAWMMAFRSNATHHLVIQDDVMCCRNFVAGVKAAVATNPTQAVTLFGNWTVLNKARQANLSWAVVEDHCWGQAIVLPVPLVSEWLKWDKEHIRDNFRHDDVRLHLFLLQRGIPIRFTVPSLVEHLGDKDTVAGNRPPIKRVARWFIGDGDPLDINWTVGADEPLYVKGRGYKALAEKNAKAFREERLPR